MVVLVCLGLGLSSFVYNIGTTGNFADVTTRYTSLIMEMGHTADVQHSSFEFYETGEQVAVDDFVEHPAIGGGIGAVLDTQTTYGQPYEVHNTFLGIASQTGIFGLVIGIGIVLYAARNAWRARAITNNQFIRALANGCLSALVGFIIHGLANYDWRIREAWLLLAFTSGIYIAARGGLRPIEQVVVIRGQEYMHRFRYQRVTKAIARSVREV